MGNVNTILSSPKSSLGVNNSNDNLIQSHMISEQYRLNKNVLKLLVMGDHGGGKSTLFNQLRCIYGKGFSKYDERTICREIRQNIISSILFLLKQSQWYCDHENKTECMVNVENEENVAIIKTIVTHKYCKFNALPEEINGNSNAIHEEIGQAIKYLWNLCAIQNTFKLYQNHSSNNINHTTTKYFITKAEIIFSSDYHPSMKDMLLHKNNRTSMIHRQFYINEISMKYHICEIGRHQNIERVLNIFSPLDIIVFLVPLSSYCQPFLPHLSLYDGNSRRRRSSCSFMNKSTNMSMTLNIDIIKTLINEKSYNPFNKQPNAKLSKHVASNSSIVNLNIKEEKMNNLQMHNNVFSKSLSSKQTTVEYDTHAYKYVIMQVLQDFKYLMTTTTPEINDANIMLIFTKDDIFRELIMNGISIDICFNIDSGFIYNGPLYKKLVDDGENNVDEEKYSDVEDMEYMGKYVNNEEFMKSYKSSLEFIQKLFIDEFEKSYEMNADRRLVIDVITTTNKTHVVRTFTKTIMQFLPIGNNVETVNH